MGCGASKKNDGEEDTADKKNQEEENNEEFSVVDDTPPEQRKRQDRAALRIQACARRRDAQARMDARLKAYTPSTNDAAELAYGNELQRR